MKLKLLFLFIACNCFQLLLAQTFTEAPQAPPFEDVYSSSIAFSDVDGDNDQDVLITGQNSSFNQTAKLYLNDGMGNFTEMTGTPFEGVDFSSIAFSDVDGDSDQDVLITGWTGSDQISKLYLNDGLGNFTEMTGTPFEGVDFSSIAFSDVDGDNDLDILITGRNSPSDLISKLYTNNGMVSSINVLEGMYFEFKLYPNPSGVDKIYVDYMSEENDPLTVKVFDLNGRLLRQKSERFGIGEQTFSIDIAFLAKGSYIIQLDDGKRKGVCKILVQ